MNLHALEIPEDPNQLPGWLDRHLCGPDLGELVAELAAVHGGRGETGRSVRDVLGRSLSSVLAGGLGRAPSTAVRQLLRSPHLLLELQELVLTSGGPYWDEVALAAGGFDELVDHGRQRLTSFLDRQVVTPARVVVPSSAVAWYLRPMAVSLATAAGVLIVVGTYLRFNPSPQPVVAAAPWGWNKPGAFPDDEPAPAYLNRLADGASEWFNVSPEEPGALAKRIEQFRAGCSALIFAEHKPLTPEDKKWLVERCRFWAGKLDGYVVALEKGDDPERVRAEANQTINALIKALRDKATAIG
jgi:hypothetical protein